jgi:phosphohistidine phosphatase SixA
MVGHNPGFERLASRLLGNSIEMPTGSLVEIELSIEDWADAEGGARMVRFIKPKELT